MTQGIAPMKEKGAQESGMILKETAAEISNSPAGGDGISAEDPVGQAGCFSMNKKAKWELTRDDDMGRQQTGSIKALLGYRGTKPQMKPGSK